MATINLDNLDRAGSELFLDSETYLNEITGHELDVHGGFVPSFKAQQASRIFLALAKAISNAISSPLL